MYLLHWTVHSKIVKILSVVYVYFTKNVLSWIRNSGKIFSTSLAWALTQRPDASLSSWSWTHSLPSCQSHPLLDLGTWVWVLCKRRGTDRVLGQLRQRSIPNSKNSIWTYICTGWISVVMHSLFLLHLQKVVLTTKTVLNGSNWTFSIGLNYHRIQPGIFLAPWGSACSFPT